MPAVRPLILPAAITALVAITTLATLTALPAPGQVAAAALPLAVDGKPLPSLAPMLENIRDAVVSLSTTHRGRSEDPHLREAPRLPEPFRRHFNAPRRPGIGSGVIVDAGEGYIVTNHHQIEGADEITVTTRDGRTLQGELVGSDAGSDIAVVKVDGEGLSAIPLGDSANLRVGDFVVAIGNPFGLGQTVTSGIVSALGRSGVGIDIGYEDFIQTDAALNPGNSGGALVDLRGRLIGINTVIFSRGGGNVGIGFAIPVNMVRALMAQLLEHGDIRRGLLGVVMQDLTPALADAFGLSGKRGAAVSRVLPDSGAAKAGIRAGDVIVQLNDTPVQDGADLRNAVGLLRAGARVNVRFYRDGKLKTVSARIAETGGFAVGGRERGMMGRLAGARFRTAAPDANAHSHRGGGVEVVELSPASPAARTGLAEKDLILSVNRRRVNNLEALERVVKDADEVLLITLLRDGRMVVLVVQ